MVAKIIHFPHTSRVQTQCRKVFYRGIETCKAKHRSMHLIGMDAPMEYQKWNVIINQ